MELSSTQQLQIQQKGVSAEEIERQMERFRRGMLFSVLDRPATLHDGIMAFGDEEAARFVKLFDEKAPGLRLMKFVPASGAATRMFKDLFAFIEDPEMESLPFHALPFAVKQFGEQLPQMPFFDALQACVDQSFPGTHYHCDTRVLKKYVTLLLNREGLHYGFLPKALLMFHSYGDDRRMPFEEHLVEWALLNHTGKGDLDLHFTLSPNHLEPFQQALCERLPVYERRFQRNFIVDHSVQHPSTDTIAADDHNQPLTDPTGAFLFRPGGHGALLYNLNKLDADMVFLKNIDNVAIETLEEKNLVWKKMLGGLLIEVMHEVHQWLFALDKAGNLPELLQQASSFISRRFGYTIPADDPDLQTRVWQFLNRPIRVCGMVKNTGEPGGGPFWVKDARGEASLQIVESAQINMSDPDQQKIAMQATHFNPVDLVCYLQNYRKEKFDLNDFSDPDTSFISVKSHQGKVLKALEHPGLWNGAMAHWITLFVEVPLQTFNPVKTVNDLLRPEHNA